ncbi:hypothetical protein EDD86DRAFT_218804 [Gorgonomyces haynaldii]|nr:hypothetical protein EDD86DRAFT_218804 [Gorgonomyces haynaldii]
MTRSHSRTQSSMFDELPDHKRGDSNASGRSQTSRMSGYNSLRATQRPKGVSMLQQSSQLSLNQESHSPKDETKKVLPEHLSDSQSSIASSHSGMPIGSNATLNERNNRASLLDGRPSLRTFPPEQSASHASSLNQQLFSPPPVEEKRISNPPVVSSQLENEIRPEETAKPIVERFKAPQLLSSLRQFVAEHPLTQQQDHEVLLKRLSELEQSINDEFKNYNQLEEQKQQLTLEIERLQQK